VFFITFDKLKKNIKMAKKTTAKKKASSKADVNKDGKVDEKDLSIVHKAYAKAKPKAIKYKSIDGEKQGLNHYTVFTIGKKQIRLVTEHIKVNKKEKTITMPKWYREMVGL